MGDLWRALGYLRKYWPVTFGAFVSLLVVTLTSLITPLILQSLINRGISASNLSVILYASLLLLLVAGIRNLFTFTQGYWSEKASQSAAYEMRNAIFAKLENLSFSYHDQAQTGQLMTRVTSDVDTVRSFTGNGLLQLVNAIAMLLGSAIILLLTSWRLALIVLIIVPVILTIFLFFIRRIGPRFRLVQQKLGNLNTILQENLAGVRVIKAFVREPYEVARYRSSNDDLLQENLTIVRGASLSFPLIFFIANLGTLVVIWFGGAQVIGGQLNIGELVAFNSYLTYLLMPVFVLGSTITSITQSAASAHRVFEVIDAPIDVVEKPNAIVLTHLHGRVAFEDVSFRYIGSETMTLTNVSFTTQPGQTVAILGKTGSGKSSIINLIPRFYDVTEGRVIVDEYDVRDVTLESLRSRIGIVLQETNLFSGTIRENIAYGRPEATQGEIEAAARAAQAHTFITSFPSGYETVVGERGVGLSGGQKQRIAIARALLLNPSILILDDSTSAVDAETEFQIQQALLTLMQNRTSFIIAQRISTIRNADLILLIERGQLIAQGTHEELLRSSCEYCELLESQMLNEREVAVA
ncbi:MAG TPA: ABC transporter ATP-binding protein [Ktedonobacteraceae bacterium]|nr:ABC transporter ATP-binding protein [Ktedonobacteraceae bacterium]